MKGLVVFVNIEQLHFFLEAADLKSMRLVAEKLYVTPQYISKSIAALEKDLNFKLFVRNRTGLELTKNGEIVYPYIRDVYDRIQYLYKVIPTCIANETNPTRLKPSKILTVGCGGSFYTTITDVFASIQNKYPDIMLNIISKESNDLLNSLENKTFDIIFCNADTQFLTNLDFEESNYNLHQLSMSNLFLICDKFSPYADYKSITLDELCNLPMSFYQTNNDIPPLFLELIHRAGKEPNIFFTSSSAQCCTAYSSKANLYFLGARFFKQKSEKRKDNSIAIPV